MGHRVICLEDLAFEIRDENRVGRIGNDDVCCQQALRSVSGGLQNGVNHWLRPPVTDLCINVSWRERNRIELDTARRSCTSDTKSWWAMPTLRASSLRKNLRSAVPKNSEDTSYFSNTSRFTGVGGRRPARNATIFSAASAAMRVRVAMLALPM